MKVIIKPFKTLFLNGNEYTEANGIIEVSQETGKMIISAQIAVDLNDVQGMMELKENKIFDAIKSNKKVTFESA